MLLYDSVYLSFVFQGIRHELILDVIREIVEVLEILPEIPLENLMQADNATKIEKMLAYWMKYNLDKQQNRTAKVQRWNIQSCSGYCYTWRFKTHNSNSLKLLILWQNLTAKLELNIHKNLISATALRSRNYYIPGHPGLQL